MPFASERLPDITTEGIHARLRKGGFVTVGAFTTAKDRLLALKPIAAIPAVPGIYVFIRDDAVAYVGISRRSVRGRLASYVRRREHYEQREIFRLIRAALDGDARVSVMVATPPPVITWNGWPVDQIGGLEQGLISLFDPPWNKTVRVMAEVA